MQIKFTELAIDKLKNIHSYIAVDSVYYADRFINKILVKIQTIELFPEIGRVVPELNESNIREIILSPYRIIYSLESDITILNIIHSKQDFSRNK